MKTGGTSSLNPHAASYVPLVKRLTRDHQNTSQSQPQSGGATQTADYSKRKDDRINEFIASTSQYPNDLPENLNFDEDFDMDLAYLQMTFPGISHQSLSDVYLANQCDLDSAMDMLNHLEIQCDDSSDTLPDTLDIGDVPESKAPGEAKKEMAGASTSAPSNASSKS